MKRNRLFVSILLCLFCLTEVKSALAHPADVYTHAIDVTFAQDGFSIKWQIKPGPMLVSSIWFDADTDQDGMVGEQEATDWAAWRVSSFTATLNNTGFPLRFDGVQFPPDEGSFQAGQDFITIGLSADWPDGSEGPYRLTFHNGVEEQKSLNWYFINATENIKFEMPQQNNSRIVLKVIPAAAQSDTQLLTTWDSSLPSLSSSQGGPQDSATPGPSAPTFQQNASQEMLLDLVRNEEFSVSFFAFALGVSLVLGALHALTPGHGKTVVAAYLVGSRGTTWHAIVLGGVVTLTHTGSVFLLGLITLIASKYILPTSIIPVLEILSGLLIVGLGSYLLWQRWQAWRKQAGSSGPKKSFSAVVTRSSLALSGQRPHEHGLHRGHSHKMPEALTWRSLIALGVSGGLVPCPDAIAILLVAVAINRIFLGLALIVSFSLGLAVVLITIGLLMVNSRRLFDRFDALGRFAPLMPIVSAVMVLMLGVGLTYGAYVRARENFGFAGTGAGQIDEAQVLYLAEDENKVTQLFDVNMDDKMPRLVTRTANGVVDYALSPDRSRVAYVIQTDDLENEIWLADLAGVENEKISDCLQAICSQPVWSPDGKNVIYEHMSLLSDNAMGLATLWWLDMNMREVNPLFQESKLPGANPRWSPDGKWLSYATPDGVRLYDFEAGESRTLKSVLGTAASWSPDGTSLLFRDVIIRDDQFVTQLFVYDLVSQITVNISPDPGFENILAAWSPDGEWIAVVRRDLSVLRGDQVWIMRADGGEARAITGTPAVLHGSLNWSPDGKYLLYDLYDLDAFPLESSLQMIDVETGEITDLGIKGYNPQWVWQD